MRDDVQATWWSTPSVADGDKEVDGCFAYRTLVVKSLKAVQSSRRQTRQGRLRTCPEQRGPQQLPISQRSGLRDDNSAGWFLPAAGGFLPAELTFGHELEGQGRAEDTFVINKNFVEASIMQAHTLSVITRQGPVTNDLETVDNPCG